MGVGYIRVGYVGAEKECWSSNNFPWRPRGFRLSGPHFKFKSAVAKTKRLCSTCLMERSNNTRGICGRRDYFIAMVE